MKISGQVVHGEKVGGRLGYPTANIPVDGAVTAENGVYAARVEVGGDEKRYGAMANLGVKPTFSEGGRQRILELHLFDFEGDLYGCEVSADLVDFIRPEQKFPSPEALRSQIEKDETIIKEILKTRGFNYRLL